MTTIALQKEIRALKQRQTRLEHMVHETLRPFVREPREELRPEYLRKLRRISRNMKAGKGVTTARTRKELKQFFRHL